MTAYRNRHVLMVMVMQMTAGWVLTPQSAEAQTIRSSKFDGASHAGYSPRLAYDASVAITIEAWI